MEANTALPWCERCRCYHASTSPHVGEVEQEAEDSAARALTEISVARRERDAALKRAKEAEAAVKVAHSEVYRELITKSQDATTKMLEETRQKAWDELDVAKKKVLQVKGLLKSCDAGLRLLKKDYDTTRGQLKTAVKFVRRSAKHLHSFTYCGDENPNEACDLCVFLSAVKGRGI